MSPFGSAAPAVAAVARFPDIRLRNHVLPVLIVAAAAAVASLGFVTVAPNRLVSGRPIMLWAAADARLTAAIALLGALLLAAALVPPRPALHRAAVGVAAALFLLLLAAAGQAAAALAPSAPGLARVSLGPALLIGFPLGVAAARRPQMQGPLFAGLNLLQTVPSIALFGLLIVPLSALAAAVPVLGRLGIAGIGMAPAVIALVLYALLPIVRSTVAGISGVAAGVIDAARGMGMTRHQLFWRVELPLAAPLLLAGLRIVTVQAIGLAVVAALIGAGGLGSFVFEGLGQYAADLVLLGALPTIALALAADFLLQLLASLLHRRVAT